ncbi:MAG: hypothetical protein ACRDZ7_22940 [Acidimicrobiia bacterium]
MNLKKLSVETQILVVAGLFLVLDLLFMPWHRISISIPGIVSVTENRSAIQSPNGLLGLLALLVAAAVVAQVVVVNFTSIKLPRIPMSWARVNLVASAAVAALLVLKLVLEIDFLGLGAWLSLPAAGAMVFAGVRLNQSTLASSFIAPRSATFDDTPLTSFLDFGPQPSPEQIRAAMSGQVARPVSGPPPAPAPSPSSSTSSSPTSPSTSTSPQAQAPTPTPAPAPQTFAAELEAEDVFPN